MKHTLLVILTLIFTSCVSYYEATDIDILVTPKHQLPLAVNDISIINNTPNGASNSAHTTQGIDLNHPNYKAYKISDDTITIDSATTTFLSNFEIEANTFPFFNRIEIAQNVTKKQYSTPPSDAIILLDNFSYSSTLSTYQYGEYKTNKNEVRTTTKSKWSIHYGKSTFKPYKFNITDTLYWNHKDIDRKDCIYQSFWSNATKATHEFIPYWKNVQRLYHSNIFHTLSLAEKSIKAGNWERAAEIWITLYNQQRRDNKIKGKMAFNMALYFESTNNIEGAKEWLNSAERIFTKKKMPEDITLCIRYRNVLDIRARKNKELDRYFNR